MDPVVKRASRRFMMPANLPKRAEGVIAVAVQMRRFPASSPPSPARVQRLLSRFLLAVLLFAGVLGIEARAHANGRFPASNAVFFDPRDPRVIWVRATFGLLVTRDGGENWHWICEKAIGFSGQEDPTYVVTPKGTLVGGTFSGIAVSRDNGCNFAFAGPGTHIVSDLAMRPDGSLVGITSAYQKAGPNGSLYDNHVLVSTDDAQTFTVTGGPIDPTLIIESIEVTPSDPARLYMSAVRGEGEKRTAAFLVSYDAGLTWVERKFDLLPGELQPYIAITDPKNADRVYLRTNGAADAQTRLLVTDDAGKTWKKIYDSPSPILGFALLDDGSRVYAGNREGLVSAPTDKLVFDKGARNELQCLGAQGTTLWACSTERSGFFVGISKGGGRGFDAKLHLDGIKGPLDCMPGTSVVKECTSEWPKLRRELGLPDPDDKPRKIGGGPAMHGNSAPPTTRRQQLGFAGLCAIGMFVIVGYYIMKRVRRRR